MLLAIVGNLYESRIFGEIAVILYLPAALGASRCVTGTSETRREFTLPGNDNFLHPYMARLEIAAIFLILAAAAVIGCVLKTHPPL